MSILTTSTVFNAEVLKTGLPVLVTVGLKQQPSYRSQTTGIILQTDLKVIEVLLYAPDKFDKGGLISGERDKFSVGSTDDICVYYIDIKDIEQQIVDIRVIPTIDIGQVREDLGLEPDYKATPKEEDIPF